MERIVSFRYSEAITAAFDLVPERISERLKYIHFFTGTDPVFAGLHNYDQIRDGRSYRNTAHVCYRWHSRNKHECTTIVLPYLHHLYSSHLYTIVHELGHCLDELLNFEHFALPINDYAALNRKEAFAEAFAAQYFSFREDVNEKAKSDGATQSLFNRLAVGDWS